MNHDLTQGKPATVLWRFCLPIFGSMLLQQLYNITDSFIAGKFIGNNALAAVGNSYEITLIFLAFAFGSSMGCSIIVAQLFGAKRHGELKTAVYTSFIGSAVLCAVLMLGGLLLCQTLLVLIRTPANLLSDSKVYLDIYLLGLPFVFFYNIATGVFSALGDSKTPFFFLACSSVANIGLDILFVVGFRRGVDGVAWATLLCQGISCLLATIFMLRRLSKINTAEKTAPFSWNIFRRIVRVAIPSILQQGFISASNIVVQFVINGFGPATIAGYSVAIKLNGLVINSVTTLGNGISSFAAQNLGAQKPMRIYAGHRAGIKLVWVLCLPIVALYFFFGDRFAALFLENPVGASIDICVLFLRIVSPFYFVVSVKLITDGVLRGTGHMGRFMIATFTSHLFRSMLALILSQTSLGTTGVWLAWPIGWSAACFVSVLFYRQIKRKTICRT